MRSAPSTVKTTNTQRNVQLVLITKPESVTNNKHAACTRVAS